MWDNNLIPSCTRLCNYTEIEKLNVFKMQCKGRSQQNFDCSDENLLIPGTTVTFDCQAGFDNYPQKWPQLQCEESGMWSEIKYLIENQYNICKYRCNNEYMLESEDKIPISTHPIEKKDKTDYYWLVPIYKKNYTTSKLDFICNGNLIRQDMVVTAAHCIHEVNVSFLIVGKERDGNLILENISDENLVSKKETHP
nr:modular serine protease-like [Drosophila bipectinata]